MATLRDRMTRLEVRRGLVDAGGIVTMLPCESAEAAIARTGRSGSVIVMPAAPDPTTWERETTRMQVALLARAAFVAAGGDGSSDCPAYGG